MSASHPPSQLELFPEDFLAHLEQRLGLGQPEVVATLSTWVSSYQPGPLARAQAKRLPPPDRAAA